MHVKGWNRTRKRRVNKERVSVYGSGRVTAGRVTAEERCSLGVDFHRGAWVHLTELDEEEGKTMPIVTKQKKNPKGISLPPGGGILWLHGSLIWWTIVWLLVSELGRYRCV